MSTISRDWATPATIGVFTLMAGTGALMFFHLDNGLQKDVHEWLGWGLVAAVGLHAAANWFGFQRYFKANGRGLAFAGVALLVFGASFLAGGQAEGGGASPPVLAMRAVTKAPLASLAPITGKSAQQMLSDLAAAGIRLDRPDATIDSAIGADREKTGRAMRALFAPAG